MLIIGLGNAIGGIFTLLTQVSEDESLLLIGIRASLQCQLYKDGGK